MLLHKHSQSNLILMFYNYIFRTLIRFNVMDMPFSLIISFYKKSWLALPKDYCSMLKFAKYFSVYSQLLPK